MFTARRQDRRTRTVHIPVRTQHWNILYKDPKASTCVLFLCISQCTSVGSLGHNHAPSVLAPPLPLPPFPSAPILHFFMSLVCMWGGLQNFTSWTSALFSKSGFLKTQHLKRRVSWEERRMNKTQQWQCDSRGGMSHP